MRKIVILLVLTLFFVTCKDKSTTDVNQGEVSQSRSNSGKESLENPDQSQKTELTAPMDKPMEKDPQCISKPYASIYYADPIITKDPYVSYERPFLTRIPYVEKGDKVSKVRFIDSCNKDKICKYQERYMFSKDLNDCNKLRENILQKIKDNKSIPDILENLTIYGSQFKSDGTSSVNEVIIPNSERAFPDTYHSGFRWKAVDSTLIIYIAMAQEDVCSSGEGDEDGCGNFCEGRKKFEALHSKESEDSIGDCMLYDKKKVTCEIADIKPSKDGSKITFKARKIEADEGIPTDYCNVEIPIFGIPVKEINISEY
jgi:hypothetical protein